MAGEPPTPVLGAILDIDGVVLDTPHERAWREALGDLAPSSVFTTDFYRRIVAGRPRREGAAAALAALGIADPTGAGAAAYAARKQERFLALAAAGAVRAFPDAVAFLHALRARAIRTAAASASRNASALLAQARIDGAHLAALFDADVSGREVRHGKPAPDLFLLAAAALDLPPASCVVVEDAPAGLAAARAGGMRAIGVARLGETAALRAAGADLVVLRLDQVIVDKLAAGRLRTRAEAAP